MFIGCARTFSFLIEREESMYVFFRELTYEIWINYGFYKGNAKFIELISFLQ